MYFSSGRKVPKAHRGGQSVHEGVAAPDPSYPNGLSAHPWGAALISPRGGEVSSLGEALTRHHIQHASSTGSLAWGLSPRRRYFAPAGATKGLCGHRRFAFDFRLRRTRHWRGVALWKPSRPPPDKVDCKSRRLRVAAHPSRAVTLAREPSRNGTPEWVSRGPKALRGVQGQRPWRVVRAAP